MRRIACLAALCLFLLLPASCRKEGEAGVPGVPPAEEVPPKPELTLSASSVAAYPESAGHPAAVSFTSLPAHPGTDVSVAAGEALSCRMDYDPRSGSGTLSLSRKDGAPEEASTVRLTACNASGASSAELEVLPAAARFAKASAETGPDPVRLALPIEANVPYGVSIAEGKDWVRLEETADGGFALRVFANTSASPRTAVLSLRDETGFFRSEWTLTQRGCGPEEPGTDPGDGPEETAYVRSSLVGLLAWDGSRVSSGSFEVGSRIRVRPVWSGTGSPLSLSVSSPEGAGAFAYDDGWVLFTASGLTRLRVEAVMSGGTTYYNEVPVRGICPVHTRLACRLVDPAGPEEWPNTAVCFQYGCAEETALSVSGTVTARSLFGTWTKSMTCLAGKKVTGQGDCVFFRYDDLESFVKAHLLASFRIDVSVTTTTGDRALYMLPSDGLVRLLKSTGKDIPVTVNGIAVDFTETKRIN